VIGGQVKIDQIIIMSLAISSFILGIVFCAPPGIITAETIRRGFARGFRPALLVQFGSLVGDSTWSLIALTGLAFLVQNNTARILLSVVGMGIMLKLTWDALKAARTATEAPPTSPASQYGDFATGALLSLSNPFNIVFWTGIGTTAFSGIPGEPQLSHFIIFFTAFMTGAFLWCFFMAGLVAWGRRFVTGTFFRWVNLACGLALGLFALQLGWKLIQNLV
jgi:threonine/homoserine/homoserine lactone efflux protein